MVNVHYTNTNTPYWAYFLIGLYIVGCLHQSRDAYKHYKKYREIAFPERATPVVIILLLLWAILKLYKIGNAATEPPSSLEQLLDIISVEDRTGDVREMYYIKFNKFGKWKALVWYCVQVLQACNSFIIKRVINWGIARIAR